MKRNARWASTIAAASSLIMLMAGDAPAAGSPGSDAAVPRTLLLDYLADRNTFTLIDARSPGEFAASHIAGAVNIPHDSSGAMLPLLPRDTDAPIVVYCRTGKRAGQLRTKLIELGYTDVRVLLPGQIVWFDDMAVFNCGTFEKGRADRTISNLIVERKREGIQ